MVKWYPWKYGWETKKLTMFVQHTHHIPWYIYKNEEIEDNHQRAKQLVNLLYTLMKNNLSAQYGRSHI